MCHIDPTWVALGVWRFMRLCGLSNQYRVVSHLRNEDKNRNDYNGAGYF
jgi:hypothetical protein